MVLKASDKKRILRRLLTEARKRARAANPSKTLNRAMQIKVDSDIIGRIHLPHYWAIFVHDGRGPIRAKGKKLVYFANPANDPRLEGGYPITRSDIKHLTREQYREGLERNRELRGTGQVYMYVVDSVGPAVGTHFFDKGMLGFETVVNRIVKEELDRVVSEVLISEGEQKTIVIKL